MGGKRGLHPHGSVKPPQEVGSPEGWVSWWWYEGEPSLLHCLNVSPSRWAGTPTMMTHCGCVVAPDRTLGKEDLVVGKRANDGGRVLCPVCFWTEGSRRRVLYEQYGAKTLRDVVERGETPTVKRARRVVG